MSYYSLPASQLSSLPAYLSEFEHSLNILLLQMVILLKKQFILTMQPRSDINNL